MSVTDDVSQAPTSRSKALAPRNINDVSVTRDVSHAEMSSSKVIAPTCECGQQ